MKEELQKCLVYLVKLKNNHLVKLAGITHGLRWMLQNSRVILQLVPYLFQYSKQNFYDT